MAPRPSGVRRSLFPEPEQIYELGVAGRKTGVTLKDSGVRDEHGMQPLDDLFSSPQKPTTEDRDEDEAEEDQEDGGASEDGRADSEDMDITTTSGIAPAALLNGNASRLPLPVNRNSRSPVKMVVNSPARNRLMARSSSPTRGSLGAANKENYDRGSSSQPAEDINTARRRLNFEALKAGGRSLSQPTKTNGVNGLNGHHEEEEEESAAVPDETEAFIEESMAILEDDGEVEEEQPVEQEEDAPEEEEEEEEPEEVPEVVSAPAAKKKPGRKPKAKEPSPAPAPAKRGRKPAAPVVEEEEQEEQDEEAEEEQPEQVAPKAAAKRGRGAKGKAAAVEEPAPAAKPGRKRRTVEEPATDVEDSSASRQSKRQRIEAAPAPATKGRGRPKKSLTPAPEPEEVDEEEEQEPEPVPSRKAGAKGKGRAPTPAAEPVNPKATKASKAAATKQQQKGGRKRQASPAPDADTSIAAIPRGPPLPKSRGLVINRREVPGDSSAITRTRSGRHSIKPLAYWRNEHVDYEYEEDEFVADHAPKSSASQVRKRKFVLPKIKEVVRVEEEVVDFGRGRSRGGGKRPGTVGGAGPSGRKAAKDRRDPSPPPEPWELNPGILGGDVVTWYPSHEFHPPALDDEVEVQEKQLAISGRAIRTQKVKDATFRYAKTVNEGFFGAGVVDLPPGAVKRPKNSRKMFMTFFVYTGRVLVTVNETVFRVGKGGMWFVPRGNYYSIENDYDQPARVFFSQGCEVQVRPSAEGEGEGDESQIGGPENSMMDTSAAATSSA
ncbi:kinetochore CENP-C fungal-like protein [Sordaria brevicollis]|uniref:CENP-C homolog n=1 Tax=Sordaria brevicollis TaxID=83679 RepID=A0AAE0U603_SORBR|nr:kinetochore CENP-C fungal-like protein [Sordaria brevicollis]